MTDLLLAAPSISRHRAHVILRREALAAGYSDRSIIALVKSGEWVRIRHGAYAIGSHWHGLTAVGQHALVARAVLKQANTELVLSHVTAALEFDAADHNLDLSVVQVTRTDRRAGRVEAGVHQHQGRLLAEDVVELSGERVTSATRTALDVTCTVDVASALVIVNHLLHDGHTSPAALAQRYESMEHNPFTLRTDLVLRLADPRIESVGETLTFFACWRHSVPRPEVQWVVEDERGNELARLDFAWPDLGCWLEFDGRQKYSAFLRDGEDVVDAVLREKRREDMVRARTGWRCLRITWADLRHPARLAARINAFLAGA